MMMTKMKENNHLEHLPKVGTVKGVYGAQSGSRIVQPKGHNYYNAINIREGRLALCRECSTPTDTRETGWVDGAPIVEQVCPSCGTVYIPIVIEL